jgi:hypothetical protein
LRQGDTVLANATSIAERKTDFAYTFNALQVASMTTTLPEIDASTQNGSGSTRR